jgi:hypothetical protein
MPAQGALYFRCTGHQVFWGKVRRSAQEAPCTRAFPSFTRSFFKFLKNKFFFFCQGGEAVCETT